MHSNKLDAGLKSLPLAFDVQGEKGAQILVVPELVDYLISSLDKVGNVSVSCTKIPLLALETKSFKAIEASLRVDALASAGFKISRSKLKTSKFDQVQPTLLA
ncbi:hypothetical protein ACOSQ3_012045 [Xanthoceras sorbifolium]